MSGETKALTVQQPWAWAIIHGGKDVENRTQAWTYRGPLAIHAGKRISDRGVSDPRINYAVGVLARAKRAGNEWVAQRAGETRTPGNQVAQRFGNLGAIIGVVDLVDVHAQHDGCCLSSWAETSYIEHGGKTRRSLVHLVLENPRAVDPIPCKGRLGLWTPDPDVLLELAKLTETPA